MDNLTKDDLEVILSSLNMYRERVENYIGYFSRELRLNQLEKISNARSKILDIKRATKEAKK